MSVDAKTVERIARLARLKVAPERLEPLAKELSALLGWIEQLNEVDVEGVEAMTSAVEANIHMREDVITDGGIRDQILANAPKSEEGFFVVPKAVE